MYGILVLVSFAFIWATNRYLVGSCGFVKIDNGIQSPGEVASHLSALLTSVDQTVSMLITVQLGLFVLVGFVFRELLAKGHRLTWHQSLGGFVFYAAALVSITLGYAARLQVFRFVVVAYPDFGVVGTTITNQALFVAISAISAVLMVVMFFLEGDRSKAPLSRDLVKSTSLAGAPSGPSPAATAPADHNQNARGGCRRQAEDT